MTIQDDVREDLQEEVFSEIGKTVTLINRSAPIYNDRGEIDSFTETSTSITAVPYNIVNDREDQQPFGTILQGEMDMAVPYTVTINIDDTVVIETVNYKVKEKAENYLPDNVVTIVRLTKDIV